MRDFLFVTCTAVFLVSFLNYAGQQQEKHVLAKYAVKCRNFGGQVEQVQSYSKPLCSKGGALFSLD